MPGGFAKYGAPSLTPNTGTGGPFVPTSTVDTDGTMAANSDARIPSQKAVVTYVAANVAGLLDYRGTYDASTNLFPATGGSGVAGAVLKGDAWAISVAGTLGGTAVAIGDFVVAEVDTPAQTAANWGILEHDLGFTPAPIASPVFTTQATAPMFIASGLTGAVAASRYVGATASLAPVSGTFAVGDFVVTQAGNVWICTVAGSPGTWTQPGSNTYMPLPSALVSGRYYRVPNAGTTTSAILGNGTVRVLRKYIPTSTTLAKIGAEVTTIGDAGSHFRIGIWSDTNGRPNSLVLDAGTILGDSATLQEISTSQVLTQGWYWFGGAVQDVTVTQPTMRTAAGILEPQVVDAGTSAPSSGLQPIAASYTGATAAFGAFGTYTTASAAAAIFIKIA